MSREQIIYVPIEEITTAPQVRQQPDPEPDKGLAVSIRENGLLHPLRLRSEGDRKIVVDGAATAGSGQASGLDGGAGHPGIASVG